MSKHHHVPDKDQTVDGNDNRVAGHNYYEHYYQVKDHKEWMLYAHMNEQDKLALNNERFFITRFGFDATFEQRAQLIKVKNELDLTDRMIRILKKAGVFKYSASNVLTLQACYSLLVSGIILLVGAVTILMQMLLVMMVEVTVSRFLYLGGLAYFIASAFIVLHLASQAGFKPLEILKKRGINLGQKWELKND